VRERERRCRRRLECLSHAWVCRVERHPRLAVHPHGAQAHAAAVRTRVHPIHPVPAVPVPAIPAQRPNTAVHRRTVGVGRRTEMIVRGGECGGEGRRC
jgi:hypothetical protein